MQADTYTLARVEERLEDLYSNLQELMEDMIENNFNVEYVNTLSEELASLARSIELTQQIAYDDEDVDDLYD